MKNSMSKRYNRYNRGKGSSMTARLNLKKRKNMHFTTGSKKPKKTKYYLTMNQKKKKEIQPNNIQITNKNQKNKDEFNLKVHSRGNLKNALQKGLHKNKGKKANES